MQNIVKRASAGAVLGGALLFTGGAGLASAEPVTNINDGLVNVGIGNVNVLRNVNAQVAAAVAVAACPDVGVAAAVLGEVTAVDQGGEVFNCDTVAGNGPLAITQNGPANSPNAGNAPGQQRG